MRVLGMAAAALAVATALTLAGHLVSDVRAAGPAVTITDAAYEPPSVTVTQGDVVTWTNRGAKQHTVTADDGTFDSGPLSAADAFGNLFDKAGTFPYHDALNPTMKGTVIVKAAKPTPTPNGTPRPTPPAGTLPPNFKTPQPQPTPTPGPAASAAPSTSPAGGTSGTGDGSGTPGVAVVALVAVVLAAAVAVALIAGRRRRDTRPR